LPGPSPGAAIVCWGSCNPVRTLGQIELEVIIVVVHVGAVKILVAALEALRKKERRVKTGSNSVWHKKWCITEFDPTLKAIVLFCWFFFNLNRFWTKLRVVFLSLEKTLLYMLTREISRKKTPAKNRQTQRMEVTTCTKTYTRYH
jgi:lysylphosphatidylglycerol synthetase-like protein (DUF2156 family)